MTDAPELIWIEPTGYREGWTGLPEEVLADDVGYTRTDLIPAMLEAARREALEEAAKACDDEADRCDDAVKWGGAKKYVDSCKAASFAIRNRASAIRALAAIPPTPKPVDGGIGAETVGKGGA